MNKHEALEFISEYFSQDNRGTAYPIYFSIRDSDYVSISIYDDADQYQLYHDHSLIGMYYDLQEAAQDLYKNHSFNVPEGCLDEDHEDFWDFDCIFEKYCSDNDIQVVPVKRISTYKGMFLLQSEAKDHLESNAHHYSKDAIVYCHHAWRADRQKDFLESIKKILEE